MTCAGAGEDGVNALSEADISSCIWTKNKNIKGLHRLIFCVQL